ncbi:acetyltransferase (GNAT) family protein [Blastococcus xanthinilyticus]|uniref:Acetyltransferase (GNAT) family protein n=1 Tax=Blastococcus xanthinilyticus TaxID=1564164 RepID=A0A5S5D579_9ACTN|nr:acetyltransferase (GNAT) family protein [Blastococcus xanthinilyticus]
MRRAGPADAAALVELRAAMFAAMGTDPGPPDAPWRAAALDWFGERLARPDRFAACVVDDPASGRVVSGAAAEVEQHTPNPWNPGGARAELFNVSSLPGSQGRGYARACVAEVLAWVREETTVGTVRLSATPPGFGIYRALGFTETRYPAMRLLLER